MLAVAMALALATPSPRPTHRPPIHITQRWPYLLLCRDKEHCDVYRLHNGAYEYVKPPAQFPTDPPGSKPAWTPWPRR